MVDQRPIGRDGRVGPSPLERRGSRAQREGSGTPVGFASAARNQRHAEINKKGRLLADPSNSWSGQRGSNPRPPPWQGGALPTEPCPHVKWMRPDGQAAHFFGGDAQIRTGGRGFAGPCLTTWPRRRRKKGRPGGRPLNLMERTTGFEPATPTLARWCSTN